MSILTIASGQSVYRGYEYFKADKVLHMDQAEEKVFSGEVSGSEGKVYHPTVNIAHPRKSHCDCPHAAGRRIICKHMIAMYFTAFPEEAEKYIRELEEYQEEEEVQQEELEDAVIQYVHGLKKSELQQILLNILFDGSEWQFDRFVSEYLE